MNTNILRRWWSIPALRGVSFFSGMRYSTKILSLLRLAVLARLLGPADLGVYGMALLVIAISEVFTETGINIMLLKNAKKLTEYIDTAWVVSMMRGVIIAGIIWILGPTLARFFAMPMLSTYLLIAAFIPLVRGVINPAIILYQQQLKFGSESLMRTIIQATDIILGFVAAVWLSSALGLLFGILAAALLEVMLSFTLFTIYPSLKKVRWNLVPKLYQETKYIIGNGMLHYLTENGDDFLIGKLLGDTGLGLYQTAYKLASAVTIDFADIINQISYPVYASLLERGKPLRAHVLKTTTAMLGLFALLAVPTLLLTQPLVLWVLGEEWLAIVPAIRILFIAGICKSCITIWNPVSVLGENLYHHVALNSIMLVTLLSGVLVLAPRFGVTGASTAVLLAFAIVIPYAAWTLRQALRRLEQHG